MAEIETLEPVTQPETPKPQPRTSRLTAALIILNLLATVGMAFLAYLDVGKRQEWARAIFLRDLATAGLPVDDKDLGTNPEAGTQAKYELDPAYIREIYKARGGTLTDKFMAVNENFKVHIRASDLDDSILAVHFAGAGKPVTTIKAEIEALRNQIPGELEAVAQQTADKAKTPDEKRTLLRKTLFPLCREGWEVDAVEKKIETTPDAKLSELLVVSVQRRLLFDILLPMEVFRPTAGGPGEETDKAGDLFKRLLVNRAAELDTVGVEDLKGVFVKRCSDVLADRHWTYTGIARDSAEKRRAAAFLLVVVSRVEAPGTERNLSEEKKVAPVAPLDQKDPDKDQPAAQVEQKPTKEPSARQGAFPKFSQRRVEAVCGVRDFTQACEDYAVVTEYLERLTIEAIQRDIGNFQYPLTARFKNPKKFVDELTALMTRLKIATRDPAGFSKAVEDKLKAMPVKFEGSAPVLEELKKLLEAGGVQLAAADAIEFEREVDALLSANAIGFLGRYQMLIKRVQDLALLVQRQERQLTELKGIQKERDQQLASRTGQEKEILQEMELARAYTRKLALDLRDKQQELFRAHAYLRSALEYNLYLSDRLQEAEKSKGGKGP